MRILLGLLVLFSITSLGLQMGGVVPVNSWYVLLPLLGAVVLYLSIIVLKFVVSYIVLQEMVQEMYVDYQLRNQPLFETHEGNVNGNQESV